MAEHEMTVTQLREWLRNWVAQTTGQDAAGIDDDAALETYGLSSRDAVTLSGELEDKLGWPLDATVAYNYPSIAALAEYLVEGPKEAGVTAPAATVRRAPTGDPADREIAIVGLSARFPGGANDPRSMWDILAGGVDATSELPEGRWAEWDGDAHVQEILAEAPNRAGWLSEDLVKDFDAEFFGMSPREAEMVDPQQRLALELAWEALENAHIPANELKGAQVGVFIGASSSDFQSMISADSRAATPYAVTGSQNSVISGRVSYTYDFRGPTMTLDTACSSALVAVHEAVQALRGGEADLALAGGVNMMVAPAATMGFAKTGAALSPDGRIKAFSSDADGICRAEGGGLLALKRRGDAERDGDSILAVIKGSAVNQDGRSNGMTAPNPEAQAQVLANAYADAGVDPASVDYIEAHGTGTILGDPIEAGALGAVLGEGRAEDKPTLLGSAKTNFGHLESAAGAAGLIKVALAMQHDTLPPSINFAGPNPYIDFDAARLRVVADADETAWPRYSGKAIAGVSGFGFGGTNAHVVLSEYAPEQGGNASDGEGADSAGPASIAAAIASEENARFEGSTEVPSLFVISGPLPSRRRKTAAALAEWVEGLPPGELDLAGIARTLANRSHGRSRGAVLARNRDELVSGLRALSKGIEAPGVLAADAPAANGAVWVFSGFGAQHRKMAKQLYAASPLFRRHLDEVDKLIDFEAGYSIVELVLDDSQTYEVENSQVGIFAIQIALVETFRDLGVRPEAVVGHSMGEVAASYAAGGLPLEEAVRVICVRSRLMGEAESAVSDEDAGAMALVEYSAEEIAKIIAEHPEFASIEPAVYAAPTHTTVGGRAKPVAEFVAWAEEQGKFARQLQVRGAGHTSDTDMLLGDLAAELAGLDARPLDIGLFSTVDKETFYPAGHEPVHATDYWVKGMRHSVWFTHAVRKAVEAGYTTFAEFNANPVAGMSVLSTVFDAGLTEPALVHTLKRKESEVDSLLLALGTHYVHGHPIDMGAVIDMVWGPAAEAGQGAGQGAGVAATPAERGYAPVPGTIFERKRLWPQLSFGGGSGEGSMPGSHVALPDGRHAWQVQAHAVPSLDALVGAAAAAVAPGTRIVAINRPGVLPPSGVVTTTLTPHPGGASLQVHSQSAGGFALLAEAAVAGEVSGEPQDQIGDASLAEGGAAAAGGAAADTDVLADDGVVDMSSVWDPESAEKAEDRLLAIIANSMGYDPSDLPRELPLLELGLDSLMAVRIKNRVEHTFSIPELELQAMRDASFDDVARMVDYAINNREELEQIASEQATGGGTVDASAIDAASKGTAGGAGVAAGVAAGAAGAGGAAAADSPKDSSTSVAAANGAADVAPRDDTERMAFGAWAMVTGAAAPGVLGALPEITDAQADALSTRLSERTGGEISAADVRGCGSISELADLLRPYVDKPLDGFVRVLQEGKTTGDDGEGRQTPVVLFHAAGGSSLVYEPLVARLPKSTPVYGIERLEGTLAERAAEYAPVVRELAGDGPVVLGGWSFGGALALEVGRQIREAGGEVALLALLDTVQPSEPAPNTEDELVARWKRYGEFAKKTYGLDIEVPEEYLRANGEEGLFEMMLSSLGADANAMGGGVIEHQRASFVDNQILAGLDKSAFESMGAEVPFVLYRAERMHDGAIELEPRYAHVDPDGGWGAYVADLEVVQCRGDHLAIVDEPEVGTIGTHLSGRLAAIDARGETAP
ncbi:polyketide synthase Pks13 [Dietzia sp.]|uniref:polyketide synthase Pks13 n=1 Tax=Dietzia sp. TaxID=1871616 RepID=UPI002FDA1C01